MESFSGYMQYLLYKMDGFYCVIKMAKRGLRVEEFDASDENLEAALRREVLEEINCEIDKIEYLGYLEVEMRRYYDEIGLDYEIVREKENWARMVARGVEDFVTES